MEPRLMLQNFKKYFMMENALQEKIGWATDGGGSNIKIFKNFYFNIETRLSFKPPC